MEEVQERMAMAMQAVDAYAGSSDAPLSAVMRAANDAATAAASASTLVRHLRTQLCDVVACASSGAPGACQAQWTVLSNFEDIMSPLHGDI